MEPWEPSLLNIDRVCGDRIEWILEISDGGGSVRKTIAVFLRKSDKKIVTKLTSETLFLILTVQLT